jgi:hypothetical protein
MKRFFDQTGPAAAVAIHGICVGKRPRGIRPMSEKHAECPLYNPLNCKEYYNPKLCAFVRKDRVCRKKKKPAAAQKTKPRM